MTGDSRPVTADATPRVWGRRRAASWPDIRRLVMSGRSYTDIASATGLSYAGVKYAIRQMRMSGALPPHGRFARWLV